MWSNPLFLVDLVLFTEEILDENLFCAVLLQQTCCWKLQVYLRMYDLLVDNCHLRVKVMLIQIS